MSIPVKTVLSFCAYVVISVIVVEVVKFFLNLNTYEALVLGSLLFLCLFALQLDYRSTESLELTRKTAAQNIVHMHQEKARQISEGLGEIVSRYDGAEGLFAPWFEERIDSLIADIGQTLASESYYFVEGQIRRLDRMWTLFKGAETDRFWATSSCESILWFTSPSGDFVTKGLDAKFVEGRIKQIRRLFIFDSPDELEYSRTRLFFLLHEQSKYEFRVIERKEFESILKGFGDKTLVSDFGIYGDHFVWETSNENQIFIENGYVCVKKARIAEYTEFFNKLWSFAIPHQVEDEQLRAKYKDYRIDCFRMLYLTSGQTEGKSE